MKALTAVVRLLLWRAVWRRWFERQRLVTPRRTWVFRRYVAAGKAVKEAL